MILWKTFRFGDSYYNLTIDEESAHGYYRSDTSSQGRFILPVIVFMQISEVELSLLRLQVRALSGHLHLSKLTRVLIL